MSLISSIGGNLVNAGLNQAFAKRNIRLQTEANKKLAKYQYDMNVEQWNRENAYNTPAQQRQRMIDAKLNPALMYEGQPQNTAASSPQYQEQSTNHMMPIPQLPEVLPTLGQFADIQIKKQQVNNLKADEEATKQQTANDSIRSNILNTEMFTKGAEYGLKYGYSQDELNQPGEKRRDYFKHQFKTGSMGQKLIQSQLEAQVENTQRMIHENRLRESGLNPSDPTWMRIMSTILKSKKVSGILSKYIE